MASFNAIDLGPFVRMKTRANRVDYQTTAYPGQNGVTLLNMGSRGLVTEADMACVGTDGSALSAVIITFLSAQVSGVIGTLVDNLGNTWNNVVLLEFYATDDVYQVPGYGVGQEYRMEFLHLDS